MMLGIFPCRILFPEAVHFRIVCVKEAPEHFILSHHMTMDAVEKYPVQLQKGRLKADELHLPRIE